jgi:peptidyl-prolyl cis-trans isomerase A (cyclophilin A)
MLDVRLSSLLEGTLDDDLALEDVLEDLLAIELRVTVPVRLKFTQSHRGLVDRRGDLVGGLVSKLLERLPRFGMRDPLIAAGTSDDRHAPCQEARYPAYGDVVSSHLPRFSFGSFVKPDIVASRDVHFFRDPTPPKTIMAGSPLKEFDATPSDYVPGDGDLRAVIHTNRGDIELNLFEDRAPKTVANFVGLATGERTWKDPDTGEERNDPFYEDILFHRIIPNFMIQTGDPTGTGRGGPGYRFADEFHDDLRHDREGRLSMANSGPDTNGSQFFITLRETSHLDDKHAVFGQVVDGMDVVKEIGQAKTDAQDCPVDDILIESVDVHRV